MNKKAEIPLPSNPEDAISQFEAFVEIVKILRRDCPWDSTQTNRSIAHLMIEEVYEAIDAIYENDDAEFSKEFGDLLLHIVLHAVIAEERKAFDLKDVIKKISAKMIHRHPHVFGDTSVDGVEQVMQNWEALKLKESGGGERKSVLDGVPNNLPALLRAERIQHKASRVGFDWDNPDDVWAKVFEEITEFRLELKSGNNEKAEQEFGDLLFALVNAARFEGIVAEQALHLTNNKFTKRFYYIEKIARERELDLNEMTLEEMDEIWNAAKNFDK
jgi:XTP/dITP diphosphohydrolase